MSATNDDPVRAAWLIVFPQNDEAAAPVRYAARPAREANFRRGWGRLAEAERDLFDLEDRIERLEFGLWGLVGTWPRARRFENQRDIKAALHGMLAAYEVLCDLHAAAVTEVG